MYKHIPYACPIMFESLNPIVTAKQRHINIQFTSGMYICPYILLEVWTIFTWGKQLNAQHWLIMEKVADITAWLPITAAQVATMNTGQNIGSAREILWAIRLIYSWLCNGVWVSQYILAWNRLIETSLDIFMVSRKECSLAQICKNQTRIYNKTEGYLQYECKILKTQTLHVK